MYGLAESTVYRLVAQKRKTGSLALKLSTRDVKSRLSPLMVEQIKQKIKEVPDITLQELIDELNLPIKVSALCEFIVHKLKLKRKKTIHPPKEIAPK